MTIITATKARANLYKLIDDTARSHTPVYITGKRNNGVLIAESDWRNIEETLQLNAVPGLAESIRQGMNTPLRATSTTLAW